MYDAKRSSESGGAGRDPWYFQRWAHRLRVGNPTRRLVLLWLGGMCESSAGYGWAAHDLIAEFAECSETTVKSHLHALEIRGVIARRREYRGGKRTADAYLLLADEHAAWPGDEPLLREPATHAGNGHGPGGVVAKPSAVAKVPVRVEVPSWEGLAEWQQRVLIELRRFADAKGASLDEMKALMACRDLDDRDHVGAAEKFSAWFIEGKGARRVRSDTNATWRRWLRDEDPAPAPSGAKPTAETGDLDRYTFGEAE